MPNKPLYTLFCLLLLLITLAKSYTISWEQSSLMIFLPSYDIFTLYNESLNELLTIHNDSNFFSPETTVITFPQLISNQSEFLDGIDYYALGSRPYVVASDILYIYDGYGPNKFFIYNLNNYKLTLSSIYNLPGTPCQWELLTQHNSICLLYDDIDTIMMFGSALNYFGGCMNGLIYNITADEWDWISWNIPLERYGMACAFDIDHRYIYFFGGEYDENTPLDRIDKYEYLQGNTDGWKEIVDTLSYSRSFSDVIVYSENVFIIYGGYTNGREYIQVIEIFDGESETMIIPSDDLINDPPLLNVYKYGSFFVNDHLFIYAGIHFNESYSDKVQYFDVSSIFDVEKSTSLKTDNYTDNYFCETLKGPNTSAIERYLYKNNTYLLFDIYNGSNKITDIEFEGYNDVHIYVTNPTISIEQSADDVFIHLYTSTTSQVMYNILSEFSSTIYKASYWLSWGENEYMYFGFGPDLYQNEYDAVMTGNRPASSLYSFEMESVSMTYDGKIVFYTHDCTATVTLSLLNNVSNISDSYVNVGDYIIIDWELINADILSVPIRIYSNTILYVDYLLYLEDGDECLLCDDINSVCRDCDEGIYIQDLVSYDIKHNNYSIMVSANSSILDLRTDQTGNIYYFQRNVVDIFIQITCDTNSERFSVNSELYFTPIFDDTEIQPNGTLFITFDNALNLSNYVMFIDFDTNECKLSYSFSEQNCSDPIEIPPYIIFKTIIENQYEIRMHSDDVNVINNQSILYRHIQEIDVTISDTFYLGQSINISHNYNKTTIYQQTSEIYIQSDELNIDYTMDLVLGSSSCILTDLSNNKQVLCSEGISFQTTNSNQSEFIIYFSSFDTILSSSYSSILRSQCPVGYGLIDPFASISLCNECPSGTVSVSSTSSQCISNCDDVEGVACLGFDDLIIEYNYWIDVNANGSILTSTCPNSYCCQMLDGCNFIDDAENLCQLHRDGVLCGSCLSGFSEVFGSTQCKICHKDNYHYLLYPFFIAFGFIFILILADSSSDIASSDDHKQHQELDYFRLLLRDDFECAKTSYLRSLMYFYQSIQQITVQTGFIFYIYPLSQILSFDFLFVFNEESGICFISNLTALSKQLWYLFLPASMFISIIIFRIFGAIIHTVSKKQCLKKLLFGYGVLWNVLLISMNTILTKLFILLSCRNIGNKSVHFYFGDTQCDGSVWIFALIILLFVIIFWIFIWFKLYKMDSDQRYSINYPLRRITKPFKKEFWFWEIVLTSRRMIFALIICFQYISSSIFQFILLIILMLYLIFHVKCYPFQHTRTNRVEMLCIITLIIAAASIQYIDYKTYKILASVIMSAVALFPFLLFLYQSAVSIRNCIQMKTEEDIYFRDNTIRRIRKMAGRKGIETYSIYTKDETQANKTDSTDDDDDVINVLNVKPNNIEMIQAQKLSYQADSISGSDVMNAVADSDAVDIVSDSDTVNSNTNNDMDPDPNEMCALLKNELVNI